MRAIRMKSDCLTEAGLSVILCILCASACSGESQGSPSADEAGWGASSMTTADPIPPSTQASNTAPDMGATAGPAVSQPPGTPVSATSDVPDVPVAPATSDAPVTPGAEDPLAMPGTPVTPGVQDPPDVPETPVTPGVEDSPDVPEMPVTPGVEDSPDVPEAPVTPGVEDPPDVPETPVSPGVQDPPDVPDAPEVRDGSISITDPVPGWASQAGGTTGGGSDLTSAITVSSMGELQSAAGGSAATVILVEPGTYRGALSLGSNKTIIGKGPGVTIEGSLKVSGSNVSNVIIRNLAVRGDRCSSYDECKAGADAVYVGNGAHHVWLDHLDISDGQDGNCDITQGGDYVTVSWTHFHYTYDKEHRFSNLIAGSDDEPNSVGKLQITYMNCWWGERVDQRQPRGRFGKIHALNNYHNTGGSSIHGVGKDMSLIVENCFYDEPGRAIFKDMGSPKGWKGIGNEGSALNMNDVMGSAFDIPYSYTAMPASEVKGAVTSEDCGAGNSCVLQ